MKDKKTIAGKPKWEYWNGVKRKSVLKQIAKRKPRKPIRKFSRKNSGRKKKIPGLFEFMCEMIGQCKWICEECEKGCYTEDLEFQLAAQAHILPKEYFQSIALHPKNILCLPSYGCGCHNSFDLSYTRKMKMKIWPRVKEIILTELIPLLPPSEYKRLPDFLKTEYETNLPRVA